MKGISAKILISVVLLLIILAGCNKDIQKKKELLAQQKKDQERISELKERVKGLDFSLESCRKRIRDRKSSLELSRMLEVYTGDECKLLMEYLRFAANYDKQNFEEYDSKISKLIEKYPDTKLSPVLLYLRACEYENMFYKYREQEKKKEYRSRGYDLYKGIIRDYPAAVFYHSEERKDDSDFSAEYIKAKKGWKIAIISQYKLCRMYLCEHYFIEEKGIDELKILLKLLEQEKDEELLKLSIVSRLEFIYQILEYKSRYNKHNLALIKEYSDYILTHDDIGYVEFCMQGSYGRSHPATYIALMTVSKYEKREDETIYYRDIILNKYSESGHGKCHSDLFVSYVSSALPESIEELIEIVQSDFPSSTHIQAQGELAFRYERNKQYDKAIEVCKDVIREGLKIESPMLGLTYWEDYAELQIRHLEMLKKQGQEGESEK